MFLLAYAIFLTYATCLPFDFVTDQATLSQKLQDTRWTPFIREDGHRESIPDMFSNVLLFLPFGVGLFYAFRKKWGRLPGIVAAGAALIVGGLFSGLVEFIQLFCANRISSVTDVITNGVGSCLGLSAAKIFYDHYQDRVITRIPTDFKNNPRDMGIILILGFIFLFSLMPFDFSLDIGHLKNQIKSIQLHPFFNRAAVLTSLDLFFPYSILGFYCLWYAQRSLARFIMFFVLGLSFALMIETLQVLTHSHSFSLNDLILNWTGFVFGSGMGAVLLLLGRGQNPVNFIFLQYLAFLIIHSFFPFQFDLSQAGLDKINLLPFFAHYAKTNFQSVSDCLQGILAFLPFGAYIMWMSQSCLDDANLAFRRAKKEAIIVLFFIGLMVEIGQVFLPGRLADVTDIISTVLGGYLGVYLFSLSGMQRSGKACLAFRTVRRIFQSGI
ncbi:MAG: VanZ family protein [bacterium]